MPLKRRLLQPRSATRPRILDAIIIIRSSSSSSSKTGVSLSDDFEEWGLFLSIGILFRTIFFFLCVCVCNFRKARSHQLVLLFLYRRFYPLDLKNMSR